MMGYTYADNTDVVIARLERKIEQQAAEIARLRADAERGQKAEGVMAVELDLDDVTAGHPVALIELAELRAAADLLARVRGNCTIKIVGSGNPTTAIVTGPPDLLRELAELLRRE